MEKTDKEVLDLCKEWFEDIIERSEKLTSGNVAHGRASICGVAKNYAEFVAGHLEERWKPSDEQMSALDAVIDEYNGYPEFDSLVSLKNDLKKLKGE